MCSNKQTEGNQFFFQLAKSSKKWNWPYITVVNLVSLQRSVAANFIFTRTQINSTVHHNHFNISKWNFFLYSVSLCLDVPSLSLFFATTTRSTLNLSLGIVILIKAYDCQCGCNWSPMFVNPSHCWRSFFSFSLLVMNEEFRNDFDFASTELANLPSCHFNRFYGV